MEHPCERRLNLAIAARGFTWNISRAAPPLRESWHGDGASFAGSHVPSRLIDLELHRAAMVKVRA